MLRAAERAGSYNKRQKHQITRLGIPSEYHPHVARHATIAVEKRDVHTQVTIYNRTPITSPHVAAIIGEIRAEQGKAANIDTDELLGELE